MPRKYGVHGSLDWCHICGLVIPMGIASSKHALFGTVDHVIPLSKGGSRGASNCRAAHFACNSRKGNKLMSELSSGVRLQLQQSLKTLLKQTCGIKIGRDGLTKACLRAGLPERITPPNKQERRVHMSISFRRWEDDGGATFLSDEQRSIETDTIDLD